MKLLWLGNSSDRPGGPIPEPDKRAHIVARGLEEECGEPVELVVRSIWPTPRLPSIVEGWLDEDRPDLVLLRVVTFWFGYESVPLRVERLLGPLGGPVRRAGLTAADWPPLGHTRGFVAARNLVRRAVGGDAYFTPEEVVASLSGVIRAVLQREGIGLLVRLPLGYTDHAAGDARGRARVERKRVFVHDALRDLCEDLHVPYIGTSRPRYVDRQMTTIGDRLHPDAAGHDLLARGDLPGLIAAWRQVRGQEPG